MGQTRAAAQRKVGFTARIYYAGFGLIALLWFAGVSLEYRVKKNKGTKTGIAI